MDQTSDCTAPEVGEGATVVSMRRPMKLRGLCMDPDTHRRVLCPDYDTCLDEVLLLGWPSWSCASCPLFHRGREIESERRDHEAYSRPYAR